MASIRMKDIAESVGVSISTVSRALKKPTGGNGSLHKEILRTAKTLGYTSLVKSGNGDGLGTISLIAVGMPGSSDYSTLSRMTYPSPSYYGDIVCGVENAVRGLKGQLHIHNIGRGPNLIERTHQVINSISSDGVLVVGGFASEDVKPLSKLKNIVLVNAPRARIAVDVTVFDDHGMIYQVVEHLIGLGHKRIAFWVDRNEDGLLETIPRRRLSGYRTAVEEFGLGYERTYCEVQGDRPYIERMEEGFKEFMGDSDRPTAIIASDDLHACTLLRLIHDHGIKVPQELSIFGTDDAEISAHTYPSLSTANPNRQLIGQAAVQLLNWRMKNPRAPFRQITLQGRLVIRESSGLAPQEE